MKANDLSCNDLMIGDWVIFHDSGYASDGTTWKEDRVCQIDAIDVDVSVKWYDEDGYKEDWPHVSTFCLSPIPLTQEILEKNGFSDDYCNDDLCYAQSCGDVIGIHINGKNGCMDEMYFKYVHQLQQALRLCRIEKEIEL